MISIANFTHTSNHTIQYNTHTYKNATHTRDSENLFERYENSTYNGSISNTSFDGNFTEYAEIPYYIKATSMTFCIVIMCLGVIGNVMVPIVILKTKDMRNSTNIFLVNLSIADLMVLLVCTPTVLVEVNSKPETWVLGKELCLAVPFVELTVAHASVLTILAISFERYYAICEPLRAGYVCTKTRATLICALAWFFAALFTSPILAIAEVQTVTGQDGTFQQCLTQAATFWQITFFMTVIIFLYLLPLFILVVLYTVIAKNLITAASKVVLNKTVDPYNVRARKQVILMLGTVVLCFFLCLMPYRVLAFWIIVTPSELSETVSPEKWYNILYFSRIMLYINSAINPILYNLMSSKFRIGFCKICICYKQNLDSTQNRRVQRTVTNGSTTSSSLTRTTNSLKKLFTHRSSLDRSDVHVNTTTKDEDSNKSNGFFVKMLTSKRFIRQQSAPVCSSPKTKAINRMRSEGSMLEISDALGVNKNNGSGGDTTKFIRHSTISKDISDIELEPNRSHGSLRRSVLINSAKAKSLDDPNKKFVSYRKIKVDCVVGFDKSRSVPILGVATFTHERYHDGTEVPVCLTQADTFWSALFFILIIAIFFIIPLGVLLVLYSIIAKNLMENPIIISQQGKNANNAGNVLRYRKQVILMLGTVVLSFFICLLPFKALTLWIIVFPPETILSLGIDGYYILLYFCRVMLYLNSAINPILYNLMSSKFREGFVKLLKVNKLMTCSRSLKENMQRRDTFNTTTSTGFSSSQNTSDSFWRRYSNRASSQKHFINRDSKKLNDVKEIFDTKVQQVKVGEIINVENTRRNSMKIIAAMNELNDRLGEIIKADSVNCDKDVTSTDTVNVDIHNENELEKEKNKQLQILNLDFKTNNIHSVTLDVNEKCDKNRFVCVPAQESKNILVYEFKNNESFV
nr:neuropeptide SIFamide receptor-like [Danaus plexippus plexippus]